MYKIKLDMYVIKYKTVFSFLTRLFNVVKRITARRVKQSYKTEPEHKRSNYNTNWRSVLKTSALSISVQTETISQ